MSQMSWRFFYHPKATFLLEVGGADGLVTQQEDFWDASFVLYGEFPILVAIIRSIRKMVLVKP